MAKVNKPASDIVETVQNNDFGDPEREPAPRGADRESEIQAIRDSRAAQRAVKGRGAKKRVITNYHDAERLRNLKLLTPEEHVDCEDNGLFPNPEHFATGSTAQEALNVPPDEGV